ncbi:hypothetical protein P3G55_02300 [Leptospira sp. 96542]|nr:hypothetical protein [Leptospira sp. 96542]
MFRIFSKFLIRLTILFCILIIFTYSCKNKSEDNTLLLFGAYFLLNPAPVKTCETNPELCTLSSFSLTQATEANVWAGINHANNLFVAVSQDGTNRVMTSLDGKTWTARSASEAGQWLSVAYGNNIFVALSSGGSANRFMSSTDGIN